MCTLVARIVKLRNVTITFFVTSGFYDRVMAEISREFLSGEEDLSTSIRCEVALKTAIWLTDPLSFTNTGWWL